MNPAGAPNRASNCRPYCPRRGPPLRLKSSAWKFALRASSPSRRAVPNVSAQGCQNASSSLSGVTAHALSVVIQGRSGRHHCVDSWPGLSGAWPANASVCQPSSCRENGNEQGESMWAVAPCNRYQTGVNRLFSGQMAATGSRDSGFQLRCLLSLQPVKQLAEHGPLHGPLRSPARWERRRQLPCNMARLNRTYSHVREARCSAGTRRAQKLPNQLPKIPATSVFIPMFSLHCWNPIQPRIAVANASRLHQSMLTRSASV